MKRKFVAICFLFLTICGFITQSNAFDALDLDANLTFSQVEERIRQRSNLDPFGFHFLMTLETMKLIENYYQIDIPKEIEDQILIGCVEEDYDLNGTSNISRYSIVGNAVKLGIGHSLRCENHFYRFPGD